MAAEAACRGALKQNAGGGMAQEEMRLIRTARCEEQDDGTTHVLLRVCTYDRQTNACRLVREEPRAKVKEAKDGRRLLVSLTQAEQRAFMRTRPSDPEPGDGLVPLGREDVVNWLMDEIGLAGDLAASFANGPARAVSVMACCWLCRPLHALEDRMDIWMDRLPGIEPIPMLTLLKHGDWHDLFETLGPRPRDLRRFTDLRLKRGDVDDLVLLDISVHYPPDNMFEFWRIDEDDVPVDDESDADEWCGHISGGDPAAAGQANDDEDDDDFPARDNLRVMLLCSLRRCQPVAFFAVMARDTDACVPEAARRWFGLPWRPRGFDEIHEPALAASAERLRLEVVEAFRNHRVSETRGWRWRWSGDALRAVCLTRFVTMSLACCFRERLRQAVASLQVMAEDREHPLAALALQTAAWVEHSSLDDILTRYQDAEYPDPSPMGRMRPAGQTAAGAPRPHLSVRSPRLRRQVSASGTRPLSRGRARPRAGRTVGDAPGDGAEGPQAETSAVRMAAGDLRAGGHHGTLAIARDLPSGRKA